jgi:CHASE3 domain sensor protein
MRCTIPLLAVLCIANTVRSADPRAEVPSTLAQEYQRALKESGQVSPNFRDAKTDEERKKAVETTNQFARRFVKLAEKYPNDPLALEVLTQAVRAMNSLDSAIQMSWQTNKTAFPIRTALSETLFIRFAIKRISLD